MSPYVFEEEPPYAMPSRIFCSLEELATSAGMIGSPECTRAIPDFVTKPPISADAIKPDLMPLSFDAP